MYLVAVQLWSTEAESEEGLTNVYVRLGFCHSVDFQLQSCATSKLLLFDLLCLQPFCLSFL